MRNHQHGTAGTELAYRCKNALLCRRVEMRGGLVQQEETRSALGAQKATGERDALALSSGEVGTVLCDPPARVNGCAGSFRHRCGDFVIGGDATYMQAQLDGNAPLAPRPFDEHNYRRSLQELKLFHSQFPDAVITPGHDPDFYAHAQQRYE